MMMKMQKMQRSWVLAGLVALLFVAGMSWSANLAVAVEAHSLTEPAKSVLVEYERIQQALAGDSLREVAESALALADAIRADGETLPLGAAAEADKLAEAQDLRAARRAFKPLSAALIAWLEETNVESSGYQEAYCPMADANWLQKGEEIENPYYGLRMLHCGTIERRF